MNDVEIVINQKEVYTTLIFGVTSRCYSQVKDFLAKWQINIYPEIYLKNCFSGNRYLVVPDRKSDNFGFNVHVGNVVYSCRLSDEKDAFLIVNFAEATPKSIIDSIQYGINIKTLNNTILQIILNNPVKIKLIFSQGHQIDQDIRKKFMFNPDQVKAALQKGSDELSYLRKNNRNDTQEPSSGISEEFEEYLTIAESYAQFEDEEQLNISRSTLGVSCHSPFAPDDYDRQDKIAYSYFIEGEYDEERFKVNTKVDVALSEVKNVGATIIEFGTKGSTKYLTLHFDEIIDFNELPKIVNINLSYSQVMYEIQQEVIDDLRENGEIAQMLDKCIGQHKPDPIIEKDLSKLEYKLNHPNDGSYPPIDSQMEAIKKGINTNDILLVQGPPGTGKTTVILEWVKYFCNECNYRVLISSQNNKAVDNVLERLIKEEGIEAIRAGNETKIQKNLYHLLMENKLINFRNDIFMKISHNEAEIYKKVDILNELIPAYSNLQRSNFDYLKSFKQVLGDIKEQTRYYKKEINKTFNKVKEIESKAKIYVCKQQNTRSKLVKFFYKWRSKPIIKEYEKKYEYYQLIQQDYKRSLLELALRLRDIDLQKKLEILKAAVNQLLAVNEKITNEKLSESKYALPDNIFDDEQLIDKLTNFKNENVELNNYIDILNEWKNVVIDQNNYALSEALLESVNLVGATCIGINSQKKFANMNFDVTIIDEAGQIQIHNALVPMSRSPKLIMLGDHKQIPPIASDYVIERCQQDGIDTQLETISLFEDLFEKLPETNKILLDTQFRMPAEIADILSEWFYESKYLSFKNKRNMMSIFPDLFSSPFVIIDTSSCSNRHEFKEKGYRNDLEADLVYMIVAYMVNEQNPNAILPAKIGVISPYKAQIKNIISKLENIEEVKDDAKEIAATLDSFQGQERDVIIYSSTRSNLKSNDAKDRIGFLVELRRLNVALSRPKKMLVFIGDMQFLSSCTYECEQNSPKEFSNFIRFMQTKVKEGQGEFMEATTLIEKLKEKDYE